MGNDTIPNRTNGQTIDQDWFNVLYRVLSGDLVPRSAGVPSPNPANLGQVLLPFKQLFLMSGYLQVGDIKIHHSYNGAAPHTQHGYMKCDGRLITIANYETEHGVGTWTQFIGPLVTSSPIGNLYLPNFSTAPGRYPVGVPSTTKDGTIPIAAVGNPAHSTTIAFGTKAVQSGAGSNVAATTGNVAQNIQPDSIEVEYYMRII